jgi:plasmid stability protein
MAQVPVGDLDDGLIERIEERATNRAPSLQREVKVILEGTAKYSMEEALAVALRWQQRTAGRIRGNSADLIRGDRDR